MQACNQHAQHHPDQQANETAAEPLVAVIAQQDGDHERKTDGRDPMSHLDALGSRRSPSPITFVSARAWSLGAFDWAAPYQVQQVFGQTAMLSASMGQSKPA